MITKTTMLKTGEQLVIRILEPPINEYYASKALIWPEINDEMCAGQMKEWLVTPHFYGEIDGEVVSVMGLYVAADSPDIGVVEGVATVEAHRKKGIASALVDCLIQEFIDGGGRALYICAPDNPIASLLYEKHGFWYRIGDGLRYLVPGNEDFDDTYLADSGTAFVRDATWADLLRLVVLYNTPEPHWLVKEYLTHCFNDMRFERHGMLLMKQVEDKSGAMVVLENPLHRVVGVATVARFDTYYEQQNGILSFRICPSYMRQAVELLDEAAVRAADLSIDKLQIYIADRDRDQKELVESAGYVEESRLCNWLRDGAESTDMLLYTRVLHEDAPPLYGKNDYYGGRQPWQVERIAANSERPGTY